MSNAESLYKEKCSEIMEFKKEMDIREGLAQQMIRERGEEIRDNITKRANEEIKEEAIKQEEKRNITQQIEKASLEGDIELVRRLLEEIDDI